MRFPTRAAGLLVVVSLLLVLAAACGQAAPPPAPTAAPAPKAAAPTSAPAKAEIPAMTIKAVSELVPPNDPNNVALAEFKKQVEAASGGKIKVDVFLGTVGTAKENNEAMVLGQTEVVSNERANLTGYTQEFGALALPYIMKSRAMVNEVMRNSPVRQILDQKIESKGVKILSWHSQGGRIIASNKPIRKLSDMAGLKVRIMNDPVMLATYQALGASPVPIAWGETYLATKQGVVDAVDTTIPDGRNAKIPEVTKYAVITNSTFSMAGIYANKKWFDGLSPEVKKIISDAAVAGSKLVDTEEPKLYDAALEEGWKKTTEVVNPDLSEFRTAAAKIYPNFHAQYGKEIVEAIQKVGEKY